MTAPSRPTWVEVDLAAIRHNVRVLTPPGIGLMAVVKADGYGHGAVEVARAAIEAGASWLGVALVDEGLELRGAGISDVPILVLSEFPPGAERAALAASLTPAVYTDQGLARLLGALDGAPVGVHVKVDTGMRRVGVYPAEATPAFVERVARAGLRIEALWTHLARSEEDAATTEAQLEDFRIVVERLRASGRTPGLLHAANTAGAIRHPNAHLDLVRIGIGMYGIHPAPGVGSELGLLPSLTWRSTVTMVKRLPRGTPTSYGHHYELPADGWVATVPVGYADGYPRRLSSCGDVLIRGRRCRVAGSVTMDQLIVDCGDLEVDPGDDVVLLGTQGDEVVSANELADLAGTIGYEIVARIGARVPRRYIDRERVR